MTYPIFKQCKFGRNIYQRIFFIKRTSPAFFSGSKAIVTVLLTTFLFETRELFPLFRNNGEQGVEYTLGYPLKAGTNNDQFTISV